MKIYKYISLESFFYLVETKKLYLRKITEWEDSLEGYVPLKQTENDLFNLISINENIYNDEIMDQVQKKLNILNSKLYKKVCYAQSWINDSQESDALWRIYSQGNGVRITVELYPIIKSIEKTLSEKYLKTEVFHHNIEYSKGEPKLLINEKNYENQKLLFKQIAGYKRTAFAHEKEYRIGFFYPFEKIDEIKNRINIVDKYKENNDPIHNPVKVLTRLNLNNVQIEIDNLFYFKIDLNHISEVLLDPRAKKYQHELFIHYCQNKKLDSLYNIEFSKSTLYSKGKWNIN